MKRFVSLMVALVMMFALAVSVTAAGETQNDSVYITVVSDAKYGFDINWTDDDFQYEYTWDPNTQSYSSIWVDDIGRFTIVNKSNAKIHYDLSFAAAQAYSNVTMGFNSNTGDIEAATVGAPKSVEITLTAGGTAPNSRASNVVMGTVAIAISHD